MNNKQQQTEWRGLEIELQALENAVAECIEIPNEWLPKEYHNGVSGCRTVGNLNRILDKRDGITDHKKRKAIKAENIKKYAAQIDTCGEFDYNGKTDHDQMYRNELAFVEAMIQGGQIYIDDFEG
jgi:hypothetical protein